MEIVIRFDNKAEVLIEKLIGTIANINNLSLVSIAMQRLINRQDGLPGLGVLYGPSGYGKTTATVAVAAPGTPASL